MSNFYIVEPESIINILKFLSGIGRGIALNDFIPLIILHINSYTTI